MYTVHPALPEKQRLLAYAAGDDCTGPWYILTVNYLNQPHRFRAHSLTTVNPEAQVVQPQLPSRVSSHLMHQNNKDPLTNMASLSDDGDPDFSLAGHPNGRIGGSAFVATHPVLHQSDRAHSQEGDGGSGGGSDSKAAIAAASRKKVSGRVCAECSATTTPQWREGPAGEACLKACEACLCPQNSKYQHLGVSRSFFGQ